LRAAPALSDLREIASAFRDLTKALAASAPTRADAPIAQPAVASQQPVPDVIYSSEDADVVPPVAQSQKMPPWRPSPSEAVLEFTGVLRLLIDQSGAVVSATMPDSTRPAYDQLLLRATRDWKFLPARNKQGMPVRYLLLIQVQLKAEAR
jgi:hypothetical protein